MSERLTEWDRSMFVAAVMSNVPKPDEEAQKQAQAALRAAMAPKVRVALDNYPIAIRRKTFVGLETRGWWTSLYIGDVDDEVAEELVEPFTEKVKEHGTAQKALTAIVESCNTWAQLRAALPDFARFIPDENAPTPNTPAPTGLADQFRKLGLKMEES
jgi:hypothetical protein